MTYRDPVNLTNPQLLMDYANEVSDGTFYLFIPISLYTVIFIFLKGRGYHTADCLMAAGFITFISTGFLFLLGSISGPVLFMVMVLTFVPAILGLWKKNSE